MEEEIKKQLDEIIEEPTIIDNVLKTYLVGSMEHPADFGKHKICGR
ncbi:hypothetical protein LCGC14_2448260 [marine sediment metagenome]|uniref:Uncharacterized protein n=1 Tax=marine sediment metagenome TaxID=412755 RepID=A0A0F9BH72_9ZZZZ